MSMQKSPSDSTLAGYYEENGYVVVEGMLPAGKIDEIVSRYEADIAKSKAKFYRQNTCAYEANRMTPAGHVIQSFLDVHHYKSFPEFRRSLLELYFSGSMLSTLGKITGHESHNLMQSMLFDANTATQPHQDWWYLDTVPNGHLLGAWIALEDIYEDAGRFYVIPGSHRVKLHAEGMSHSQWLAEVKRYFDENRGKVRAPALKKGDVLFWNSRTVHGALPTSNPSRSRRSLTAHYMPSTMTFGNLFTSKPWVNYEQYNGHKYFANQPEYSMKADIISRVKVALYDSPRTLRFIRKFQKKNIGAL